MPAAPERGGHGGNHGEPSDHIARLARALDADDFAAIELMLAPDCRYVIGGSIHRGSREVVATYRQGSVRARELFDVVVFRHRAPEAVSANTFRVDFVDELTHQGEELIHHSVQEFTLGDDGLVVEIRDVTGPEEAAHVDEFLQRHGLHR